MFTQPTHNMHTKMQTLVFLGSFNFTVIESDVSVHLHDRKKLSQTVVPLHEGLMYFMGTNYLRAMPWVSIHSLNIDGFNVYIEMQLIAVLTKLSGCTQLCAVRANSCLFWINCPHQAVASHVQELRGCLSTGVRSQRVSSSVLVLLPLPQQGQETAPLGGQLPLRGGPPRGRSCAATHALSATPGADLPAVTYCISRSPQNVCQQAVFLSTCCWCGGRAQSDPQPHWEAGHERRAWSAGSFLTHPC